MVEDIFNQRFFDETLLNYHFDFDENYLELQKRYRHLSLFSICFHFLTCLRFCEKISPVSISRVRNYDFLECNAYNNLMISFSSEMLDLTSNHRIDLDVFLCNSEFNLSNYAKDNGKCCFFQIFEYAQVLFAAFSVVLIRMYLNITLKYFSFLSTNLRDEKRVIFKKNFHIIMGNFILIDEIIIFT